MMSVIVIINADVGIMCNEESFDHLVVHSRWTIVSIYSNISSEYSQFRNSNVHE